MVRFTLTACITFRKQCLWVGEPLRGTLKQEHKVLTTGLRCMAFPNCVLPIRPHVSQVPPSSGLISACVLQWPLALHLTPIKATSNFTVQVHLSSSSSPHVQDSHCCSWSSPHEPPLCSGPFNPHSWQNLFFDVRTAHSQVPMWVRSTQNNLQGASGFPSLASLYPFFPSPVSGLPVSVCLSGS